MIALMPTMSSGSGEPVIYVSHAGRDGGIRGLPSYAFHAVGLKSLPRVLLSLADRDVSIKHVRIKQECCVKKVITVGVQ
jgi:hypothetical protein